MTKIIANMVARNEAENYLPQVLERLSKQVDLICFTDDCSDDDTINIARQYTDHIFTMKEPTFVQHEGRLRQAAWENLENVIGSDHDFFVLAIDADEMLYDTKHPLRSLIDQSRFDVINVSFYHMWNETQFRVDKAWRPNDSLRLFRYYPFGFFSDRRLACGSEPTYVITKFKEGRYLSSSGLFMKHLSYIKDEDKRIKYERYSKLDGGEFHANAHIESIMDPNPDLRDWPYE
jgi:glycosyltransferase involved in cell wall biosynthesis